MRPRTGIPTLALLTAAALWIASDNWENSNMCGGVKDLAGICLLPY
jgi:hypothetical protein